MATGSTSLLFRLLVQGCVSFDPHLHEPNQTTAHYPGGEPPVLLVGSGAGSDSDRDEQKENSISQLVSTSKSNIHDGMIFSQQPPTTDLVLQDGTNAQHTRLLRETPNGLQGVGASDGKGDHAQPRRTTLVGNRAVQHPKLDSDPSDPDHKVTP